MNLGTAILFPAGLSPEFAAGTWGVITVIGLATLVSEDLTCIGVGLLAAAGRVGLPAGLLGCFLGIFVGDLGLWLVGRSAGRGLLRWPWIGRRLPAEKLERFGAWFDRRGLAAVFASRFVPGSRLPLYVAAGLTGRRAGRFVLGVFLAALVWVPALVLSVALLGERAARPLTALIGQGWPALLVVAAGLFVGVRASAVLTSPIARARWFARLARLWRWEFWPAWLFYAPLVCWLGYLTLRYRSATVWTLANPGIPLGGVVGESKYATLSQLSADRTIPSSLIPPGDTPSRVALLRQTMAERGWSFPLVLKPDAGQRGVGVKRIHTPEEADAYLAGQPAAVLAQTYHPGPFEAGDFYCRLPGEATGRIVSITDKQFPRAVGDGTSTLAELIWRHPRHRMQADTFLARHADQADRVVPAGAVVHLALAGNHCQGTLFREGRHLWSPDLERAVDAAARRVDGFFFGRFDVRYGDPDAFRAGRDFAVVELNGVTSESTNLYDPARSLLSAYRILFGQWALAYRVGHLNRRCGYKSVSLLALWREVRAFYRDRRADALAD